jgi:hypothetical protein
MMPKRYWNNLTEIEWRVNSEKVKSKVCFSL